MDDNPSPHLSNGYNFDNLLDQMDPVLLDAVLAMFPEPNSSDHVINNLEENGKDPLTKVEMSDSVSVNVPYKIQRGEYRSSSNGNYKQEMTHLRAEITPGGQSHVTAGGTDILQSTPGNSYKREVNTKQGVNIENKSTGDDSKKYIESASKMNHYTKKETSVAASNGMLNNGMVSYKMTGTGIASNGKVGDGMAYNGMVGNGMVVNGMASNGIACYGMTSNGMVSNRMASNDVLSNVMTNNGMASNEMAQYLVNIKQEYNYTSGHTFGEQIQKTPLSGLYEDMFSKTNGSVSNGEGDYLGNIKQESGYFSGQMDTNRIYQTPHSSVYGYNRDGTSVGATNGMGDYSFEVKKEDKHPNGYTGEDQTCTSLFSLLDEFTSYTSMEAAGAVNNVNQSPYYFMSNLSQSGQYYYGKEQLLFNLPNDEYATLPSYYKLPVPAMYPGLPLSEPLKASDAFQTLNSSKDKQSSKQMDKVDNINTEMKPYQIKVSKCIGLCAVCNGRPSGNHYGVLACEGCKLFFKRAVYQKKELECVNVCKGDCEITVATRKQVKRCRLKKCYAVGMREENMDKKDTIEITKNAENSDDIKKNENIKIDNGIEKIVNKLTEKKINFDKKDNVGKKVTVENNKNVEKRRVMGKSRMKSNIAEKRGNTQIKENMDGNIHKKNKKRKNPSIGAVKLSKIEYENMNKMVELAVGPKKKIIDCSKTQVSPLVKVEVMDGSKNGFTLNVALPLQNQ